MTSPAVSPERLRMRLEALAAIGADPSGRGTSRFPYSPSHLEAVRTVGRWMEEAGLAAGCDPLGNLVGFRPGTEDWPAILLGSHLDTVPHGGMFDGALGVVAGVEVAQALREAKYPPRHALAVVGFADEEGHAFDLGMLASRCLVGEIPAGRFGTIRGRNGQTLAAAMAAFTPDLPRAAVPSRAGAYLELHIEQGPVLVQAGRRIAVVTAITGIARTTVVLEGEAAHAGTTPMRSRRDALVGAAEIVLAIKSLAEVVGPPTVATVGRLWVEPGATNVVPGRVEFTVDVRTPDASRLFDLCRRIDRAIGRVGQRHGLTPRIAAWDQRPPVPLDASVQQAIAQAARDLGHELLAMPSGAGHDAMILAPYVPAGMIFVPSRDGISHSPREWTEWEDAALGAAVLLHTVLVLDSRGPLDARMLPVASQAALH
ncbi:MAG: Zn-dependent hydrolase [Armatimonadota bacterium]|nr:Zn-dependent hydrolase [Armatimonadota bacterium]